MGLLKGIDIILYEKTETGVDKFNKTLYEETAVKVRNVLVQPVGSTAVTDILKLYGKRAEYELCIPKGDKHIWEDRKVEFFGKTWRTFGFTEEYIEDLVPLSWNKKVKVERYG